MSIICKLFGHNYGSFSLSPMKVSGICANTTLTAVCQRCKTVHRSGMLAEASETYLELSEVKLQLSKSNMLINSVYGIAMRCGRTTDWGALDDDCVTVLLDNQKVLKLDADSVLTPAGKDYRKPSKRTKV